MLAPAQIISVRTHSPEPASTSPTPSPISSTNTAAMAHSPGTSAPSTQTVLPKALTPTSSSASPTPTVSAMTSILPAYDNPSASTSVSQPIPHPTQLAHSSRGTLPATQSFIIDHHGSQLTPFSPRRLRSDTSNFFLDLSGIDPHCCSPTQLDLELLSNSLYKVHIYIVVFSHEDGLMSIITFLGHSN